MGAALLVTLREGIEAVLIITIVLAYLRQLGRSDQAKLVWWGTAVAAALSLVAGGAIVAVGAEFEGRAEEIFEGLVSLAAVGVLTWMIFWMRRQGARIKSELQERVDSALVGGGLAVAGVAFFAVLREGIETALFLFSANKATGGNAWATVIGGLLGLAIAAALGYLLYRGGIKLNMRTFFKVTGGLILVVAAGLFAFSIHELQEAGLLPFLTQTAWDTSAVLSDEAGIGAILRALFGYHANPSVLEVFAWVGYLLVTGIYFFRPPRPLPEPALDATTAATR
ncbi:MAG: iron uptake transporter permease EfeU [Actinomycetota bacterium]